MTRRVAVIGAGAAGLCALRHLSVRPKIFHAICFEKNLSEGGTWIYTEETGTDKNDLPVQSSMYKNLRYYLVTFITQKIRIFTFLNSS
jgi:cation diffusion facilitator CzcD-associated flavoprotein CzcO